ncbi:hypothetical protein T265_15952, partial [Opisthorchis viverrini]
ILTIKSNYFDEDHVIYIQNLRGEWSITQVGRMETQPLPDAATQLTVSQSIDWRTDNVNANSNGMPVLNFESMTTDSNPVFDWVINRLKQLVYPPPECIANASCSSIHRVVSLFLIQGKLNYNVEAGKGIGCTFRPGFITSGA